jgi:peroxiredoxin
MKAKHRLDFPILSDTGNAFARRFGVVHDLPEDLQAIYRQFGIDLSTTNADGKWELPLPTRLVVARDGTIAAIDADPDYTIRPEPASTLEVVRSL